MKNKISCILGEYKKNKVKIIILSKKSYDIKMNINKKMNTLKILMIKIIMSKIFKIKINVINRINLLME